MTAIRPALLAVLPTAVPTFVYTTFSIFGVSPHVAAALAACSSGLLVVLSPMLAMAICGGHHGRLSQEDDAALSEIDAALAGTACLAILAAMTVWAVMDLPALKMTGLVIGAVMAISVLAPCFEDVTMRSVVTALCLEVGTIAVTVTRTNVWLSAGVAVAGVWALFFVDRHVASSWRTHRM